MEFLHRWSESPSVWSPPLYLTIALQGGGACFMLGQLSLGRVCVRVPKFPWTVPLQNHGSHLLGSRAPLSGFQSHQLRLSTPSHEHMSPTLTTSGSLIFCGHSPGASADPALTLSAGPKPSPWGPRTMHMTGTNKGPGGCQSHTGLSCRHPSYVGRGHSEPSVQVSPPSQCEAAPGGQPTRS